MKRILLFLFFTLSLAVHSQYTLIPDSEFERYLISQGYDSNIDGKVLTANIISVTDIHIFPGAANINIKDLSGIEDFKALRKLNVTNCNLTDLDLSKNINLTELICSDNKLVNLNVNGCVNLREIGCPGNDLTSLDFSTNINLQSVYCLRNYLTSLNLSTSITFLDCSFNKLSNLNVSMCTNLSYLSCMDNELTNLNVTRNTNLKEFWATNNKITNFDVSKNLVLTNFSCAYNQISQIDVTKNSLLSTFGCSGNQLTNLDISQNAKLSYIECKSNKISSLDFTHNPELFDLNCNDNQLTDLNITNNPKLYKLLCTNNKLNVLDVSKNTDLNFLNCEYNQIKNLDVTKNIALGLLRCNDNDLKFLDLRSPVSWTWWNGYNSWLNNPDLKCIYVPDANFFGYYWNGRKDDTATYFDGAIPKFESSTQTICSKQNPTINDIVVNGYNLKWFDSETSTIQLPLNTILIEGKTYYAMNTAGSCESSRSSVKVTLKKTNPPVGTSPQNFCNIQNLTLVNLSILGTNIKWYSSNSDSDLIANTTTLMNGVTYYATQSNNGCESSKTPILVNITNTSKPSANSPQTFCIKENSTLGNVAITGQNLKWYDALTAGTLLPNTTLLQNGKIYYASQTINGCESERAPVTIKIQDTPAPTGDANQPFCTGQNPTLQSIVISGENIKWYDATTAGNILTRNTTLQNGKTYYASQTINSCEGPRLTVTVSIQNTPAIPTGNTNPKFCKSENAMLSSIILNGQSLKWYDTNISAAPLPNTTLLQNNTTYYVSQTIGCEGDRVPVLVNVYDTALPSANTPQTFCIDENAAIANIAVIGNNLKWYDASTAGNILANTTFLENKTYYVTQTDKGCESLRLAIIIKVQDTQAPIAEPNQSFCVQQNAAIKDIKISGQDIKWYTAISGGTNLSDSTSLENGIIYYASQNISTCESLRTPIKVEIQEATFGDCINFVEELPFPKFFTPNNDGYNDTWTIDFAYLAPNSSIKIFDRYGKFIKEFNKNTAWDGTSLGRDLPTSDYWFIVTRLNGVEYRSHFSLKR